MKYVLFSLMTMFPLLSFAQVADIFDAEALVLDILERLNYLFWLVAIAVFFWGIVKFIGNAEDSAARETGRKLMIWGVVSFLVLVSLWGFVTFILQDTLGIFAAPVNYVDKDGVQY